MPNPQPGGWVDCFCQASHRKVSPVWLNLLEATAPTGTALGISEACKLLHQWQGTVQEVVVVM